MGGIEINFDNALEKIVHNKRGNKTNSNEQISFLE